MHIRNLCQIIIFCLAFSPMVQAQTLVIGVAGPMTGPLQEAGKAMAAGALAAAAKINSDKPATTGAPFSKIEIIIADDGGSQTGATAAARKLATAKATAVIGHYSSAPLITTAPLYAASNMIMIAPAALIDKTAGATKWNVFRMGAHERAQAQFAARTLARNAHGPIAIVHDGSGPARHHTALLMAEWAKLNTGQTAASPRPAILQPASQAAAQSAAQIASELASRVTQQKITTLYWLGNANAGAELCKMLHAAEETSAEKPVIYSNDILASPDFPQLAGAAFAGVRMILPAAIANADVPPNLADALKAAGTHDVQTALAAFSAVEALAAARSAAPGKEGKALAQFLKSGPVFKTRSGPMSFNENGDRREQLYVLYQWTVQADGKPGLVPFAPSKNP